MFSHLQEIGLRDLHCLHANLIQLGRVGIWSKRILRMIFKNNFLLMKSFNVHFVNLLTLLGLGGEDSSLPPSTIMKKKKNCLAHQKTYVN